MKHPIETAAQSGRSLKRLVGCPHVERTEHVIRTPNGMLMLVMACVHCGDQQVGAHHYACNTKLTDRLAATPKPYEKEKPQDRQTRSRTETREAGSCPAPC
jgi:hypothetical protein